MRLTALNQQAVIKAIAEATTASLLSAWPHSHKCEEDAQTRSHADLAAILTPLFLAQQEHLTQQVRSILREELATRRSPSSRPVLVRLRTIIRKLPRPHLEMDSEVHPLLILILLILMLAAGVFPQ